MALATVKQDDLSRFVVDKYDDSSTYMNSDSVDLDTNVTRWKKYYAGTSDETEKRAANLKSAVMPPWAGAVVDRTLANFVVTIFTRKPYFGIFPQNDNLEDILSARMAQDLVDWQVNRPSPFYQMNRFIQSIAAYGFGCMKSGWDFVVNDVMLTNWDIRYFFFPSYSEDLTKLDWGIFESWVFLRDLIKQNIAFRERFGIELYKNLEGIAGLKGSEMEKVATKYPSSKQDQPIQILEYWDDGVKLTVAGKTATILEATNPVGFVPAICGSDIPKMEGIYGTGEIEAIEDYIKQIATVINQRNDNVIQSLIPAWLQNSGVDILNEDLLDDLHPGDRVQVKLPLNVPLETVLAAVPVPMVTQQAYMEVGTYEKAIQDRRGFYDYARGAAPEQRETATAVRSLQEAGSTIPKYVLMFLLRTALIKVPQHIIRWDQIYLDDRTILAVTDTLAANVPKFRRITKKGIQSDYYYLEKVSILESGALKDVKRAQLMEALQIIAPFAQVLPRVNFEELIVKVLDTFDEPGLSSIVSSGQAPALPPPGGAQGAKPGASAPPMEGKVMGGILGKALGNIRGGR